MKKQKTICIDFDGVLHDYSNGFQGEDVFGNMIGGSDIALSILKKKGWRIIIHTTRPATEAMKKWLKDNKIPYDYINKNPDQPKGCETSKPIADIYLDDRAICFRGRWDFIIGDIASFSPWQLNKTKEKENLEECYDRATIWEQGGEIRIKHSK